MKIDQEAIAEIKKILNDVCDGKSYALTAGRLMYLLDQLDQAIANRKDTKWKAY